MNTGDVINDKPFAPAADRNKEPILQALQSILAVDDVVFEFGSGTAQHACHIASAMPDLKWQPSDVADKLPGMQHWIDESECVNILLPHELDLANATLPQIRYTACFTANTLHIVSWPLVEKLFQCASTLLHSGGKLCVYGPFTVDGHHTSDGNRSFDASLRQSDPSSGIRDITDLDQLAGTCGFQKLAIIDMPANNKLLHWISAPVKGHVA